MALLHSNKKANVFNLCNQELIAVIREHCLFLDFFSALFINKRRKRLFRKLFTLIVILVATSFITGLAYAAGITIPLGFTLNTNTSTLNVPGNVTNAGTLQVSSGAITLTGDWSNSGTFTQGTSTVTLNGTSQSISGTTTFYGLSKTVTTAAT